MTYRPFAALDNYMLTREYIKACNSEEVDLEPDYQLLTDASLFTLADVINEAQHRGFTMDDLEEMSIQLGY
jgi:hypothetical protein